MFTRIENLGPLTRLGDLGRVLAFAHCPGWRWMLWVTTTRILVLDSLQRCLWWSEAHPGAHASAAAAIGQDGRWGVLYRTKEEDWTSAAMNSRVLTGMAGSHTPPVDPADLWMHSCFLPTSAGVGCDIGFHGWIGQWGNHTSTGKGSRNLYSFNKRGNSYAPMESLQGELWYLQEDFLVFERSFAVIPAQGIPVFEF